MKRYLIVEPFVQFWSVKLQSYGGNIGWTNFEVIRMAGNVAVVRSDKSGVMHFSMLEAGVHLIEVEAQTAQGRSQC